MPEAQVDSEAALNAARQALQAKTLQRTDSQHMREVLAVAEATRVSEAAHRQRQKVIEMGASPLAGPRIPFVLKRAQSQRSV